MENLASQFSNSASAVLQLGDVPASVDLLDDDAVVRAIEVTTTHQRSVDAYLRTLAASIARRSTPEMGYAGLARRRGFATPEAFIQSISGCTYAEAARLVQLGRMVANVEDASAAGLISADPADSSSPGESVESVESGESGEPGESGESGGPELRVDPTTGELALVPVGSADDPPAADLAGEAGAFDPTAYWQVPIVEAVSAGRISASSADSLRRGLGQVDAAITARQLRETADSLLRELQASPTGMSAEQLLRRARQARGALDSAAVERGEKERRDQRYLRRWKRNGMRYGTYALPEEDGGIELDAAIDRALGPRIGGPRFVDPTAKAEAEELLTDDRTNEQIAADTFVDIMRRGIDLTPGVRSSNRRPSARVIITRETLENQSGVGHIEGSDIRLSFPSVERHLCDTGTVGVVFDEHGQCVDVGRDQRLFTERQRVAMAVRDGGCRFDGCERPPDFTEAHHIDYWARDHGKTNVEDGILLCRFHHMLVHNNNWQIIRDQGMFWLKPPRAIDPQQTPRPMPSKTALVREIRERHGFPTGREPVAWSTG